MAKPQVRWVAWFRRPALAAALTVLMAGGIGLFFHKSGGFYRPGDNVVAVNDAFFAISRTGHGGTAICSPWKKVIHDLYSDFDLLDDLEVQHDVTPRIRKCGSLR